MPYVQAYRSDDEATVSFPAVPVICRPCVVETDPQCAAAVAVGPLAAVIGEARATLAIVCKIRSARRKSARIGRTGGALRNGRVWFS